MPFFNPFYLLLTGLALLAWFAQAPGSSGLSKARSAKPRRSRPSRSVEV